MSMISHLDMFYDTRQAIHINNSSPANNPYTELSQIPTAARIQYADYPERFIDCEAFEAPNGKGYETAQFLLGRAMLDPDAVVLPA